MGDQLALRLVREGDLPVIESLTWDPQPAAALAGLVFLAVSINLRQILSFPHLPGRAGQTLVLFTMPLLIAILLLVPGQPRAALGAELLVTAVVTGGFQAWITRGSRSDQETPFTWLVGRIFPAIVTGGLLVVAAVTLLAEGGGGLYWACPACWRRSSSGW
jgi:modulator of FtsH protease